VDARTPAGLETGAAFPSTISIVRQRDVMICKLKREYFLAEEAAQTLRILG
jgi:hypothetical protein